MTIGGKVRYYRKQRGMSQKELANGICDISLLSKIENGYAAPTDDLIQHFCKRLGIPDLTLPENGEKYLLEQVKYFNSLLENCQYYDARKKQVELETLVKRSMSPDIETMFTIFKARLCVVTGLIAEADALLMGISSQSASFNWENAYFYHFIMGTLHANKKDMPKAGFHLKMAVAIGDDNHYMDYRLYYTLSLFYKINGFYAGAILYGQKALEMALIDGSDSFVFNIKSNLALSYSHIGEHRQAIQLFNKSLIQLSNSDNKNVRYNIYHNLGCAYQRANKMPEARADLYEAFKFINDAFEDYGINCLFMAKTYHTYLPDMPQSDEIENAKKWLLKGLEAAEKHHNDKIRCLLTAYMHMWFSDPRDAANFLENEFLPMSINYSHYIVHDVYTFLSMHYQQISCYKQAYSYALCIKGDGQNQWEVSY